MRKCPAARLILAELERDRAQESYDRTKSRRAYVRLVDATTEAIAAAGKRAGRAPR